MTNDAWARLAAFKKLVVDVVEREEVARVVSPWLVADRDSWRRRALRHNDALRSEERAHTRNVAVLEYELGIARANYQDLLQSFQIQKAELLRERAKR